MFIVRTRDARYTGIRKKYRVLKLTALLYRRHAKYRGIPSGGTGIL